MALCDISSWWSWKWHHLAWPASLQPGPPEDWLAVLFEAMPAGTDHKGLVSGQLGLLIVINFPREQNNLLEDDRFLERLQLLAPWQPIGIHLWCSARLLSGTSRPV